MNIRSIFKQLSLLALPLLAAAACNEPDPDSISVVATSSEEPLTMFHADPLGDQIEIKVLADSWDAVSSAPDWCLVQKDHGYKYGETTSLFIYPSAGAGSRTATVTFTSGSATHLVVVSQAKDADYVNLLPEAATVGFAAQDLCVFVDANFAWEATPSQDWVTIKSSDDKGVVLSIAENPSDNGNRMAQVNFTSISSGTVATFNLTQLPRSEASVSVSPSHFTFGQSADRAEVAVATTLYNPAFTVTSSEEWCVVGTVGALADGSYPLSVEVVENPSAESRSAVVNIVATSENGAEVVTTQLFVTQNGMSDPSITLGRSEVVANHEAQLLSVNYAAVGEVSVTVDQSWISATATNDVVELTLQANENQNMRSAEVTIATTSGGKYATKVITVYQNGIERYDLSLSVDNLDIAAAGEKGVALTATTDSHFDVADAMIEWIAPTESWCKMVSSEGMDNGGQAVATFDFEANSTYYDRQCVIVAKLTVGHITVVKSVNVTQKN